MRLYGAEKSIKYKYFMTNFESVLHVASHMALENEMARYNCKTKEELSDHLWNTYSIELVIDFEDT